MMKLSIFINDKDNKNRKLSAVIYGNSYKKMEDKIKYISLHIFIDNTDGIIGLVILSVKDMEGFCDVIFYIMNT